MPGTVEEVLESLRAKADPEKLAGMSRYGIAVENRLGVAVPDMRAFAKQTGVDHQLALALWETGIAEAKIVASMVDIPAEVTEEQMEAWVVEIDSWDICDQVCMNLFEKTTFAWDKIIDWSQREEEFVKRSAFALIACLAWHDKGAKDEQFIGLLPVIKREVTDERNFVKKAVNWALRNIGKRNTRLNQAAIATAKEIRQIDTKSAGWIASNAIRELESEAVQNRLKKKEKH